MKAYGVTLNDLPKDCTGTGKYGSSKIDGKCSCGKKHGKRSKDSKSRKSKERKLNKINQITCLNKLV